MFKAVVFDMDGVLIEAKEWHYEALNIALAYFGYQIDEEMHRVEFDGLPTRDKLRILSEKYGLPRKLHEIINEIKQERTLRIAASQCFPKAQHLILLSALKRQGYKIGVATNSIRETAETMLTAAYITPFLDVLITNQDVKKAKPAPEIYLKAAQSLNLRPNEILVVEDNHYGVRAATEAGCGVLKVNDTSEVHIQNIESRLDVKL